MLCDEAKERSPLLAKWGIPDKSLRRDLARVSVADGDGRDIVEAVDRDVFVVRDGDVQMLLAAGNPEAIAAPVWRRVST
jgi:hypothetical protein